jgi:WD40-like Beta Propeller Repeat
VFSPDGKRIAGSFNEPGGGAIGRVKAFVDGWTSLDYSAVATSHLATSAHRAITFSPDSRRFACLVSNSQGSFAIVDGKESPAYTAIQSFQFSADSKHYAFETTVRNPGGGHGGWVVVVDGVAGPTLTEIKRGSVTFSPDGGRLAYAGSTSMTNSVAVIDGQEHKMAVAAFQPRLPKMIRGWGMPLERTFAFSRDGKSLAYVAAASPQGGPGCAVVDGKPQVPGHLFVLPAFSADGKRFAHLAMLNQKWFLSVDGKAAAIDGEVYEAPNSLAFQDDGSVRFLVVKNNMLYRVVATAKSGTN